MAAPVLVPGGLFMALEAVEAVEEVAALVANEVKNTSELALPNAIEGPVSATDVMMDRSSSDMT